MTRMPLVFRFGLSGVAFLVPVAAEACAVCGTGPGVTGDPTARGFYWGILFLMAMPFAVAGSIGAWLVYRYWRASVGCWRKVSGAPFAWTHKESGR
ncbi:MAG: hypothetical protein HY712_05390 [candidate division NC10 bacterium]|nr:hypothetical protein [candidate division NC10 bacterium]